MVAQADGVELCTGEREAQEVCIEKFVAESQHGENAWWCCQGDQMYRASGRGVTENLSSMWCRSAMCT